MSRKLKRYGRREVGIKKAFAERIPPAPTPPRGQDGGVVIPPGFEADIEEVQRLKAQMQRDPQVIVRLKQVYERILERLRPGDYMDFRAATQNDLGVAYAELPTGDRAANLDQAIACYREALRFRTPETAPREYAATQNNLGIAYAELPTGERAANLAQAIACYREALRFRTPETAPFEYATTQNNLGAAYAELPTGDQAANLAQAIACFQQALHFWTPETAPFEYREVHNSAAVAWLRAVRETLSLTRREFVELLNKTIASTTASDPEHFPLRTISETMYRNYEAGRLRVPFFVRSAVGLVEAEYKEKIGSNSNEEVEPPQFLEQIQSLEEMVRISKEQRGGGKRVIEYAKAVEQAGLVTSTEAGTDDTDKAVEEEQLHYPELYREWERIDEVIAITKHKLSNIDEASRRIDRRLALLRSQMPHD